MSTKTYKWIKQDLRKTWLLGLESKLENPTNNIWDLPLSYDPWAQAAISIAEEESGLDYLEIGELMGLSREKVKNIEEIALRKLKNLTKPSDIRNIKELLRDNSIHRDSKESLDYSLE